jgi:broad specificity phosphatase PhoE
MGQNLRATGRAAVVMPGSEAADPAGFAGYRLGRVEAVNNSDALAQIYLARHGETEWTITGQHTGRTDLPLTARGERNAASLGKRLHGVTFDRVVTSPLQRARRTCELAGFADRAEMDADLVEWDYGEYEGRTSKEIRVERPRWDIFEDGCPGGESPDAVGVRADQVISRLRASAGRRILLFGHGHFFRVLAARWIMLAASDAHHFVLSTAALSVLGYEHSLADPAILLWNDDRHAVE